MLMKELIPYQVIEAIRALNQHQHSAGLMGEGVPRLLKSMPVEDFEVVTSATYAEIKEIFPMVVREIKKAGSTLIRIAGVEIEIHTLKKSVIYDGEDVPFSYELTNNIVEDSKRRDFTLDTMFLNPINGTIIDKFDARRHLNEGMLVPVGNPLEKIENDPLMMLRAARLVAERNFELAPELSSAISAKQADIVEVSPRRIRDELLRICATESPQLGFEAMLKLGLMQRVLPEVYSLVGCKQDSILHPQGGDVWSHTMSVVRTLASEDADYITVLAGLLHDIGTPKTIDVVNKEGSTPKITNYGSHAYLSACMATDVCNRLRIGDKETRRIREIIKHHDSAHQSKLRLKDSVFKWLRELEELQVQEDVILLQHADSIDGGHEDLYKFYLDLLYEMDEKKRKEHKPASKVEADTNKSFALAVVKQEPKPVPRHILEAVREAQEEGLITL